MSAPLVASQTSSRLRRARHAHAPHLPPSPGTARACARALPRGTWPRRPRSQRCRRFCDVRIAHIGPSVLSLPGSPRHSASAPLRELCVPYIARRLVFNTAAKRRSGARSRAACAPRPRGRRCEALQQAATPAEAGSDPGARGASPYAALGSRTKDGLVQRHGAPARWLHAAAAGVRAHCVRCVGVASGANCGCSEPLLPFPPRAAAPCFRPHAVRWRIALAMLHWHVLVPRSPVRRRCRSVVSREKRTRSRLRVLHQLRGVRGGHHLWLVRAQRGNITRRRLRAQRCSSAQPQARACGGSTGRAPARRCGNDPYHAGGYGFTLQGDHNVRAAGCRLAMRPFDEASHAHFSPAGPQPVHQSCHHGRGHRKSIRKQNGTS